MKLTVIGGGSTYTPELVKGLLERIDSLPLQELCLMDIDKQRLDIVGGFAQRMVAAKDNPFKVLLTTDQQEAISGADYVLTQLRVGMMEARKKDEYLGNRHGLIGQETTGVGGMSKALRTIPVLLDIAEDIRRFAPTALLVNFTNPAGLVTEALFRHAPTVQAVGVCNVAITTKMNFLEELENRGTKKLPHDKAQLDTLGLNHLTWHRGFTVDGEDLWPQIIEGYVRDLKQSSSPDWEYRMIEIMKMIPNYYLQFFYHTERKLAAQDLWPPSRAEQVMLIEKGLLDQYADPTLYAPPDDLMKRGGAYYSTMAIGLLNAHYNDLNETHIVNVAHKGAVRGWPKDWVLEMPCLVNRKGIQPLPAEPLPDTCFGLIAQVKSYELLTVNAAVDGSRESAYQALLANPIGPHVDQIPAFLDDMLVTHKEHLPRFWN